MKHIVVTLLGLGLAALHANAQASANGVPSVQVSPDETLRTQPSVVDQGTNGNITIRGGAQQGGNLFHSFLEFSISAGQRVCFENPSGVTNILSRVTGDRPSNIDGTLGVNGNANLFFINPNGLLFGPNSRLDMAGVFVGSTASSIQLADRTTYSAVAPAAPLLTMAVPTGLQFGATAESIRLNNANSLLPKNIVEQDISKQGSGFILVGGDISLENSKLSIPGGKFEFAAVGPNTSVDINFAELSNPHGLSIAVPTAQNRMDVLLLNGSRLRTTGKTSGDVSLIANNIEISGTLDSSNEPGRSVINVRPLGVANKPSEKQGGNVTLDATNNILMNGYWTGISTSPQETSDIDGGDVRITAKSMQILNGAYLQTSTGSTSTGKGGSISLDIKKSLELSSPDKIGESDIESAALGLGQIGNNINIQTGQLIVKDGAQIFTDNSEGGNHDGLGQLGSISIIATDFVMVNGVSPQNVLGGFPKPTGISAFTSNSKNAGDITVQTPRLSVENGAAISNGTDGSGKGGDINIAGLNGSYARSVEVSGSSDFSQFLGAAGDPSLMGVGNGSRIRSISGYGNSGRAGNINIKADNLIVRSGARVEVGTLGTGAGGIINVTARKVELLDGGQLISATRGGGSAGNVIVQANEVVSLNGIDTTFESKRAIISLITSLDHRGSDESRPARAAMLSYLDNPTPQTREKVLQYWRQVDQNQGDEPIVTRYLQILAVNPTARKDLRSSLQKTGIDYGKNGYSLNYNIRLNVGNASAIVTRSLANATGDGGKIEVTSPTVQLDRGEITAASASTAGGEISLKIDRSLILRNQSQITASAAENGKGGNIQISAPNGLIVAVPRENSDIAASAVGGQGGRINIQTSNVLGFSDIRFNAFSNIDATSTAGPQGIVTINTLGNDPSQGIQPEPIAPGTPDLSQVCPNSRNVSANSNERRSNQFVNGGKGGVVASTGEPLSSSSLWTDPTSTQMAQNSPPPSSTLTEAQGWVAGRNGTVLLTTQSTQPIDPTLQANRSNCYGR